MTHWRHLHSGMAFSRFCLVLRQVFFFIVVHGSFQFVFFVFTTSYTTFCRWALFCIAYCCDSTAPVAWNHVGRCWAACLFPSFNVMWFYVVFCHALILCVAFIRVAASLFCFILLCFTICPIVGAGCTFCRIEFCKHLHCVTFYRTAGVVCIFSRLETVVYLSLLPQMIFSSTSWTTLPFGANATWSIDSVFW